MKSREAPDPFSRYGVEYYAKEPALKELKGLEGRRSVLLERAKGEFTQIKAERIIRAFETGTAAVERLADENPYLRLRARQVQWGGETAELIEKAGENLLREVHRFFNDESLPEHHRLVHIYQGIASEVLAANLFRAREVGYEAYRAHSLFDSGGGIDYFVYGGRAGAERFFTVQVKTHRHEYQREIEIREITDGFIQKLDTQAARGREEQDALDSGRACLLTTRVINRVSQKPFIPLLITVPRLEAFAKIAEEAGGEPEIKAFTLDPRPRLIDKWKNLPYVKEQLLGNK